MQITYSPAFCGSSKNKKVSELNRFQQARRREQNRKAQARHKIAKEEKIETLKQEIAEMEEKRVKADIENLKLKLQKLIQENKTSKLNIEA